MSPITTHVLDVSRGLPAMGVPVRLEFLKSPDRWQVLGQGTTNHDGRLADLLPPSPLEPGTYRLVFDTGAYFSTLKAQGFYPYVEIVFTVGQEKHYHVPLLLSPYSYSTYRGS